MRDTIPPVHERVRQRRKALGMEVAELARCVGCTDDSYRDLESYPDEVFSLFSIAEVRALAACLSLNVLELFEIPCAHCAGDQLDMFRDRRSRPELIAGERQRRGLTREQVSDSVSWPVESIEMVEGGDEAHLDFWSMDDIGGIADVLGIPVQLLLNVKCPTCGR